MDCPTCRNPDVWFRCNQCQKSDHFLLADGVASCDCGARYAHGSCTCGASVGPEGLVFVPFDQGPMALADLEIAWGRVAALVAVGASMVLGGLWWVLR